MAGLHIKYGTGRRLNTSPLILQQRGLLYKPYSPSILSLLYTLYNFIYLSAHNTTTDDKGIIYNTEQDYKFPFSPLVFSKFPNNKDSHNTVLSSFRD